MLPTSSEKNTSNIDRDFWITIRRAMLMASSAIAKRFDLRASDADKGIDVVTFGNSINEQK